MQKALIIGGAISGCGAARLLNSQGYEVYLTDKGKIEQQEELEKLGVKVYPNGHPDELKELKYDLIVKNPGIKYDTPFVKYFCDAGYKMYNEIEIATRYGTALKIGAVTGTNGKTTTTTILGEILKENNKNSITAGNIGHSLCDYVYQDGNISRNVALEIAAFQLLGTEDFKPKVSVIINLTPDHLDYFGTLEKYYNAKTLVYKQQTKEDYFLRNVDDPEVMKYCQNIPATVIDFSLERNDVPLKVEKGKAYYNDLELFSLDQFSLPGKHNLQNALIAAGMAYLMGCTPSQIASVIHSFKGVEHRIEYVTTINGVKYYNDSKGTNVDASIVALKAFEQPIHLLAGGYDKHLSFEGLRPYLGKIKQMYVFGATKEQLKELDPRAIVVENMDQALSKASQNALKGEVVLLSPACASWDQFPNYEVRGKLFKEAVNKLKKASEN